MNRAHRLIYAVSVALLMAAVDASSPAKTADGAETELLSQHPVATATTLTVSLGDSLERLAAQYDVSASKLAQVNRVVNPKLIYAGQTLNVPEGGLDTARNTATVPVSGGYLSVSVRNGESLVELSINNSLRNPVLAYCVE
jgi:LysM repeat protein